ncbi:MAG TPA: lysophospholipid acyltransferase family protein [Aliidongia sp.]|uniref:lysophospholipid acyltransferase family protein n=1 Tax=Aliidongia sp. TaxID=1914230 RepID=UPI002DDCA53F|nr:lysophospholipid acyltransferase family protein [Aliidongia sp.]HEV2676540.1 lysophospholipid acyltransferase family protein [Aliidongia sp.]
MAWTKRLLRADGTRRILCWLVAAYIRLVHSTSRFTTEADAVPSTFWRARKPFILAFWHGRLLMAPMAWPRDAAMNMLISGHNDGRIIADAIHHFGLGTIVGSKSKGGSGALRAIVRALNAGQNVGFTPDGPRGPCMRASAGVIAAARLGRVPIIPLSYATTRRRILGSWDRFHLALPFSRGLFLWGEALQVPPDADATEQERLRLVLEARMNALTAEADRRCGHAPVEPAPVP